MSAGRKASRGVSRISRQDRRRRDRRGGRLDLVFQPAGDAVIVVMAATTGHAQSRQPGMVTTRRWRRMARLVTGGRGIERDPGQEGRQEHKRANDGSGSFHDLI